MFIASLHSEQLYVPLRRCSCDTRLKPWCLSQTTFSTHYRSRVLESDDSVRREENQAAGVYPDVFVAVGRLLRFVGPSYGIQLVRRDSGTFHVDVD